MSEYKATNKITDSAIVMLALNEPRLSIPTVVNVVPELLTYYISARVCRAALERRTFSPINVDEVEPPQQMLGELLKLGRRQMTEV